MLSLTSPRKTLWHAMAPGSKLAGLLIATVGLFWVQEMAVQLLALGAVSAMYLAGGRVFFVEGLRHLRPVAIFIALLLAWHVLTGNVDPGITIALRILTLVALANLVTMTTRLDQMLAIVNRLLRPFARFGLPIGAVGLAIAMVIRFTPRLSALLDQLRTAWRARSARRAGVRVAVPLIVAALDDAERVAEAVYARGGVPKE